MSEPKNPKQINFIPLPSELEAWSACWGNNRADWIRRTLNEKAGHPHKTLKRGRNSKAVNAE